jgi:hypothetical protein
MANKEFPSRETRAVNLEKINQLLGIEKGDYEPLPQEEIRLRIAARIKLQDEIILPERINQGRLTAEWRRYIHRRTINDSV